MVRLGDFGVTVVSSANALPEFDDPDAVDVLDKIKGPGVVKYIEATADTVFGLDLRLFPEYKNRGANELVFEFFLNGHTERLDGVIAVPDCSNKNGWYYHWKGRKFQIGEQWKVQPLRFGHLHVSDNATTSLTPAQALAMGSFKIEISAYKRTSVAMQDRKELAEKIESLPEKAFKGSALDLTTKMGEAENTNAEQFWYGSKIGDQALATIIMKYRSRKALQDLGLVPRSPTPTPRDEIDSLTTDELKERLRQMQESQQAAAAKLKKEATEQRGTKRRASTSTLEAGPSASDTGLLNEAFGQVQRHLESIADAHNGAPKKLRKENESALLSLKMLRTKLMTNGTDDDDSDDDVMATDGPAKGPAPGQEVVSLSDSE